MVKEAKTVIGKLMGEVEKCISCPCKVYDFHVKFWSGCFKIGMPELEKVTEKVARFGIIREEQGMGNQEPVI